MSGFLSFVKKETLHILRDKRTMLIVLLLPMVQVLLFGFAISTEVNNINFAVVAPNRTEAIRQQVERMDANPYFTFKGYIPQSQIEEMLRRGEVVAVIAFDENYDALIASVDNSLSETAVQFILDASNPNNASTGMGYLTSTFQSGAASAAIAPATRILYNPQMKSSYNFVPGIMGLIFILICAMMTSISIVREKETGTMEVLLVSPVRPIWIVFAKMIPYFLLSCIALTFILLLARFVLEVPMSGSLVTLISLSLLYLILSLALGLLISTLVSTQVTAMLISGVVMLFPIIMFSGMMFPIENLPLVLKPISYIVPARWYIEAMRKLMIGGMSFSAVWIETGVLLLMTTLLVAVALKKFKDKLE